MGGLMAGSPIVARDSRVRVDPPLKETGNELAAIEGESEETFSEKGEFAVPLFEIEDRDVPSVRQGESHDGGAPTQSVLQAAETFNEQLTLCADFACGNRGSEGNREISFHVDPVRTVRQLGPAALATFSNTCVKDNSGPSRDVQHTGGVAERVGPDYLAGPGANLQQLCRLIETPNKFQGLADISPTQEECQIFDPQEGPEKTRWASEQSYSGYMDKNRPRISREKGGDIFGMSEC